MKRKDRPRHKFNQHRFDAKKRGVPFLLTFEEWFEIWNASGHFHERGPRRGQYCMSRFGDKGPYAVGNVFIQLTTQNSSDAQKGVPKHTFHKSYRPVPIVIN